MVQDVLEQPHRREWSLQGFGMLRTYLSFDMRLNIWNRQFRIPNVSLAPFVAHSARLAVYGPLDLIGLACSAYLQGVWDGTQAVEHSRVIHAAGEKGEAE